MKKKILTIGLVAMVSMLSSNAVLAAAESSVVVPALGSGYTDVVQGSGQYGRITLVSNGKASAYLKENCNGTFEQTRTGILNLDYSYASSFREISINYYMSSSCSYKLQVTSSESQAKGYIRNYN